MKKALLTHWKFIVLLCLTLGLAPFYPEPHIWGKLKWLAGGAKGMTAMDVFDIFLHGFPFVLLLIILLLQITKKAS